MLSNNNSVGAQVARSTAQTGPDRLLCTQQGISVTHTCTNTENARAFCWHGKRALAGQPNHPAFLSLFWRVIYIYFLFETKDLSVWVLTEAIFMGWYFQLWFNGDKLTFFTLNCSISIAIAHDRWLRKSNHYNIGSGPLRAPKNTCFRKESFLCTLGYYTDSNWIADFLSQWKL